MREFFVILVYLFVSDSATLVATLTGDCQRITATFSISLHLVFRISYILEFILCELSVAFSSITAVAEYPSVCSYCVERMLSAIAVDSPVVVHAVFYEWVVTTLLYYTTVLTIRSYHVVEGTKSSYLLDGISLSHVLIMYSYHCGGELDSLLDSLFAISTIPYINVMCLTFTDSFLLKCA